MNLIFISSEQYPNGGAAANRHMAYSKGLAEAGHRVTFILLSQQDIEYHDPLVRYICMFPKGKCNRIRNKLVRWYFIIYSIFNAKKEILDICSEVKVDAIILLDVFVWQLFPFISMAKKKGIRVLHERTEYPFVVNNNGLVNKFNFIIYTCFIIRKFDGIYVISKGLKEYFDFLLDKKKPVEIINMVVDPSRFDFSSINNSSVSQYIAYCGTMEGDKDGVDILIKAFGNALAKGKINSAINLMLIGDNSNNQIQKKLNKIAESSRCLNNIIFAGKIERNKIPSLLNHALALVLSRPDNKQAEGGFPTKLGEYLSTGKPVIITDVGDIRIFLKDGYNAYIAKPDSIESFSDKISELFSNYSMALHVGSKGKELVYNEFNYFIQAIKLANFIESI